LLEALKQQNNVSQPGRFRRSFVVSVMLLIVALAIVWNVMGGR
jgi:hypothetical protein